MIATRSERIREKIKDALGAESVEVEDESHLHAGHAGARDGRGHFRVVVVSAAFEGKNRLQRHRMVYEAVGDMMRTDIHALGVQAYTPEEF